MPSRNRRRVRNFTIALVLLGLAAWIVPSYFSAERYRRRLQAGLEQVLHRPVKFGALSFHLLPRPGFSIDDAEVGEDPDFGPEPFARVENIDCQLRWHSLWRSRMDFAYLHLDHPNFNIVLNSHGEWNVQRLLLQSGVTAPVGAAPGGRPSESVDQLDLKVDDARINFQVGPNKKPFALTGVQARLQVNPAARRVQFDVTASPLRSDLSIPTPGPVEVKGIWTPGADLRGPIDAQISTRGALLYDWIPVLTGRNPQVYGVIDSDVHVTGAMPDLTLDGDARLTQFQRWEALPPSDPMPWTFRYRAHLLRGRERVQVESLEASFAESHIHVSGSVDNLQSDPQLDLVVSLERSRLEDLAAMIRRLWPTAGNWNVAGRVNAMLAIQGSWKARRYGGFVGAQQVSLETPSGSVPLSDVAVRISNNGAVLAPLQITLAPRVAVAAQGAITRTNHGPRYEIQLAAKSLPLHQAVAFGRELGVRALQGIDATGSATASARLSGSAWPLGPPIVSARAEIHAARMLIPGLTEPLNLPRASLQLNGDQIVADPVLAVMGTSIFKARLLHQGPRRNPWTFDVQANSLRLEQAALWFTTLGLGRPFPLLASLPGLASLAARRDAASQIFANLNAEGRFSTPALSYRALTLSDFQATFDVAGRKIRMKAARFRSSGGRGEAKGSADLTNSPPVLSATAALTGVPAQLLAARLPVPVRLSRGLVNVSGTLQTRGLTRDDLAENLTGHLNLGLKDAAFTDFDPLGALAQQAHWGVLEPVRDPVTFPAVTLNMDMLDRRFVLQPTALDLSGAVLHIDGSYTWAGATDLNVRADLRRLRRRWIEREDDSHPRAAEAEVRLGGTLDHLVVNPQTAVVRAGRNRVETGVR